MRCGPPNAQTPNPPSFTIANALASLTGVRLLQQPMLAERVKVALTSAASVA